MSRAGCDAVGARILRPVPSDDELLTSYLTRTACRHGVGAYRYCSYFLRGIPIWNRDFDRSASDYAVRRIANLFELEDSRVREMTLREYEPTGMKFGISPWITAAGPRLRSRRAYRLQYCPQCLTEETGFKRVWRLACVVGCERHGRLLRDCCVVCGAPIALHRVQISILRCHICGAWLTVNSQNDSGFSIDIPFDIQRLLAAAVAGQCVTTFGRTTSGLELARCAAALIRIARERVRGGHVVSDDLGTLPPVRVELMRVADRAKVLALLERALLRGPSALEQFCRQFGLLQGHFAALGALPEWLSACVGKLPVGTHGGCRSTQSTTAELAHIRLRRRPGWREAQAKLLVRLTVGDRGN